MTIANEPCITIESDKAPEVSALVQPNSVSIGLKKTPKAERVPYITTMINRVAATTI
jgi:hypothetical protein